MITTRTLFAFTCVITFFANRAHADNPSISTIFNGASFANGPIAPGEVVSLFGTNLGGDPSCSNNTVPVPTSCNGTSVMINGGPVPIFLAAVTQINFQVPVELTGTNANIQVLYQTAGQTFRSEPVNVRVSPTAPGLFQTQGFLTGFLAASGQLITTSNPAHPGDVITAMGTGFGVTNPAGTTGNITPAGATLVASVALAVGGKLAAVAYAGAGNSPGVARLNFTVPQGVASGNLQTIVTVGGVGSPPVVLPVAADKPTITGVSNNASGGAGIESGSWVSIYGTNLSATTRLWQAADFNGNFLPTTLDGVMVTINGRFAAVYYISPSQINVQAPIDFALGQVPVFVTNNLAGSATGTAILQQYAPGFYTFQGKYVAAVHADGVYVAPAGFFGSPAVSRPAQPGETLMIFGTGFGPTTPEVLAGLIVTSAAPLSDAAQLHITIGNAPVIVEFAGITAAGEYQFNVVVPALPDGDHSIIANIGGFSTQAGLFIPVKN